ncbi:MAG: hypothetical protein J6K84_03990 [Oscillospiraceae bacterium]|nr:hypothetical protein [Oscillospiraceae bacterium]
MKKILSIVLAVSMLFALALNAGAAVGSTNLDAGISGETSKPVKVTVNGVEVSSTIYYVVVEWDSLNFTYDFDEAGRVWDPEQHEDIITEGNAGWEVDTANGQDSIANGVKGDITVINHSNAAVQYSAELAVGTDLGGVSVALSGDDAKTLTSGVGLTFATADKGTFAVEVTGAPTAKVEAITTVKTLNIEITAA